MNKRHLIIVLIGVTLFLTACNGDPQLVDVTPQFWFKATQGTAENVVDPQEPEQVPVVFAPSTDVKEESGDCIVSISLDSRTLLVAVATAVPPSTRESVRASENEDNCVAIQ